MLIVQMVLKYMLTHRYTKENELLLETAYFDVWGKNEKCKTLVEWWKEGYFNRLELIDCDWIDEYIDGLQQEAYQIENPAWNDDEIATIEEMVDTWRKKRR